MADPISTSKLPGYNMHPDAIDAAAKGIRGVGSKVSKHGAVVQKTWNGLSAHYHAPEQSNLLLAMNPAKKSAENFGSDMDTAATALETFASEVRTIKAAVAKIKSDAVAFNGSIHNGKVTVTEHHVMNRAQYEMGTSETTHSDVDWKSDYATVQEYNGLIRKINDQQEALWAAERKCANSIRDIYGAPHIYAASKSNPKGYGVDQIPDNASGLPWGNTINVKEGCGEKVVNGVMINGVMNGLGGFVGFHYKEGDAMGPEQIGFSWSTAGQQWTGLGQLATGVAMPLSPVLSFLPGPVGKWFNSSTEAASGLVPGLLGINVYNHDPNKLWFNDFSNDPLYNWRTNPAETAGLVGFNIATLFIPGPKGAGALTKAGEAGHAAEEGSILADGTRAADGLGDASKLAGEGVDLGKTVDGVSKTDLSYLGKNSDFTNTFKGVDNVDNFNVPHDGTGVHSTNHGGDAPAPRDHETPQTHETSDQHTGDTQPGHDTSNHSGSGHDGGNHTPAHDGVNNNSAHNPSGHSSAHQPAGHSGKPADHTPANDPSLAKTDPQVRTDLTKIQNDIKSHLQTAANNAWRHAIQRAKAEGVPLTARRLGTYAHTYLADYIKNHGSDLVDPKSGYQIRSEQSFDRFGPVKYGTKGSIRPDIVIERIGPSGGPEVLQVIDLKTGKAGISSSWETKVQNWLHPLDPSETLRPNSVTPPPKAAASTPAGTP